MALPFQENWGFRKMPPGTPLSMKYDWRYYLQDWECECDGVTYVVECNIGSAKFCEEISAPEYRFPQLENVCVIVYELGDNRKKREILEIGRYEEDVLWAERGREREYRYYDSIKGFYFSDEGKSNKGEQGDGAENIVSFTNDITTIFDIIAHKTRFKYGKCENHMINGGGCSTREINDRETVWRIDEKIRFSAEDFERRTGIERVAEGVAKSDNGKVIVAKDSPSQEPK